MRPWFKTKAGYWMPVYDDEGYHPEWIESELELTPEEIKKVHDDAEFYAQLHGGTESEWYKNELNWMYDHSQRIPQMPD